MVTQTARLAMVTALLWFGFGVGGRAQAASHSRPRGGSALAKFPFRLRHRWNHARDLLEHR